MLEALLKKYDRWTWGRFCRHLVYWGAWTLFYTLVNSVMKDYLSFSKALLFELTVVPVKIATAYTLAYWVMPKFLYPKKYTAFVLTSISVLFFFGILLFYVYGYVVHPYILDKWASTEFRIDFLYKVVELLYISGLVISIKFFQNNLYQERYAKQLQIDKTNAELKFLKNQIQPHFLFNTLNNIYGMVLSKEEKAGESIVKLSDMLAYMLYESDTKFVPLSEEIENLENYISLETIRYNRKLDLKFEKEISDSNAKIAPMILLPFIENAFKHGPAKEEGKSQISIHLEVTSSQLTFRVQNSFNKEQSINSLQSGIGLVNVRKRLDLIYSNEYKLELDKRDFWTAKLTINFHQI